MIGNYFAPLSGSKRTLLATLATSALLFAGCSNMTSTAPDVNPFSSAATLKGTVHGGNQPISGATVSLYYAGQTPAAPVLAATTTSANNGTGSFNFVKDATAGNPADNGTTDTFSCPTNTDPLVYVVAKGGNTLNDGDATKNNSAAAFIALYGTCSELTSANQVYMSEATTVATMATIAQFFDPATETLSTAGTGQQKIIIDGVSNTIALLASNTTGNAVTSTTLHAPATGANINPAVTVVATPEFGKVNLIANIISSCINNASSAAAQCSSLFSAAVPPVPNTTANNPASGTFPTAKDTLQALYYMFTNPASINSSTTGTANVTTLFGLAGGAGAPYQPYSNVQPTDWTIAINYTSTGACGTPAGGTGSFINSPVDIAIDGKDNVWFANTSASGNLSELSAAGVPTTCIVPGTGAVGGTVIDSASNVWVGTTNGMYRYNPGTGASLTFSTGSTNPLALAADGVGNVYFSAVNGSTGSLYQLPGAATATLASQSVATQISSTVGPNPVRIKPDFLGVPATLNNIWVTSGSSFVSQVAASNAAGSVNGFLTTQHTTGTNSYGLSVTHAGNVFVSDMATNALTQLALSNGTYSTPAGWPFAGAAAGVSGPTGISTDPRFNTWVPNVVNNASTASVSVISNAPAAISPSTGFQKPQSYLSASLVVAIDQAGNVWVAGYHNAYITEIVGATVPKFQPYAVGLSNGRFENVP